MVVLGDVGIVYIHARGLVDVDDCDRGVARDAELVRDEIEDGALGGGRGLQQGMERAVATSPRAEGGLARWGVVPLPPAPPVVWVGWVGDVGCRTRLDWF